MDENDEIVDIETLFSRDEVEMIIEVSFINIFHSLGNCRVVYGNNLVFWSVGVFDDGVLKTRERPLNLVYSQKHSLFLLFVFLLFF